MVERAGSEWLLLGRPDIQVDWILQEYRNYQQVLSYGASIVYLYNQTWADRSAEPTSVAGWLTGFRNCQ